jgi:NAD(P)-dependent dehydrogenase (short-subunit alcohol dehydrogenase family)
MDISRYDEIQNLVQTVKREFGKLDILVNCAFGHIGEDTGKSLLEATPDEIIEFNGIITGIQLLTRELAPLLQASNGRAVYIVADWGRPQHNVFTGTPPSATVRLGSSVFSSGKWAVEGFAGSLERELGIPTTAINPGIIASIKPSTLDQEEPKYFDIDDPVEAIEDEEAYSGGWGIPLIDVVASTILALRLHSVVKATDLKPFTPDYDGLHV